MVGRCGDPLMAKLIIRPIEGAAHPSDVEILVDGVKWDGIQGYKIDHVAGLKPAVHMVIVPEEIQIELPDAQINAMRKPLDRDEEEPEQQPRTRVVLGAALSVLSQADADLRQGVDISRLAAAYCSLGVRQRFTVMQVLGLLSAEEYAKGMTFAPSAEALDREAITRAIAAGKLKQFDAAIQDAADTYRICTHGGDFATCDICISEWMEHGRIALFREAPQSAGATA